MTALIRLVSCLGLACGPAVAYAEPPATAVLEAVKGEEVRLLKADGTEVAGRLLSYDNDVVVVVESDGRVVTVARPDVDELRIEMPEEEGEEMDEEALPSPSDPRPASTGQPARLVQLVDCNGKTYDLFTPSGALDESWRRMPAKCFRSKGFSFVDEDGDRHNPAQAWVLTGKTPEQLDAMWDAHFVGATFIGYGGVGLAMAGLIVAFFAPPAGLTLALIGGGAMLMFPISLGDAKHSARRELVEVVQRRSKPGEV